MKLLRYWLWIGLLAFGLICPAWAQTQCVTNALAGGTGDALTVPLLPCGLATNLLVLTLSAANTTTTPTLQMVGYGALPIKAANGANLSPGQLPGAGAVVLLTGTGSQWLLLGNGLSFNTQNQTVELVTGGSPYNAPAASEVVVVRQLVPGATTINLPVAAGFASCPTLTFTCPVISVKDGAANAGTYNITVQTTDGTQLDIGGTSTLLNRNSAELDFVLDGTKWDVK